MRYEKSLKILNHKIKVDKDFAQILIEISPSSKTYSEVKKIIKSLGINIIQTDYLSSNHMLIKLDVPDMRDLVLKLSENGFTNIKGFNAKCS